MASISNTVPTAQTPQVFKPAEVLNIFADFLAKNSTSSKIVYLRGIYFKKKSDPSWKYAYDILKDEDDQREITVAIPHSMRDNLKDGSLVQLGGNINRTLKDNGYIQIQLHVTRIEVVQEHVVSEEDAKKAEIRTAKCSKGYKNVSSILEDRLFRNERPLVALVFAKTSITMADFDAGKESASSHMEFEEHRVSFSKSNELVDMLKYLDNEADYDAIALIRGGGGGIEALDDLAVLECVSNLETPFICAIGHVEENLFIKHLADYTAPTPNGLGTYFSSMVERVIQKRNNSRAVLVQEVKSQYIKQIETAEKQNKALQEQIDKMTQASVKAQADFKSQSESLTKQLATLQDNLKKMREANEEQTKNFTSNLAAMQETNKGLQESLTKVTGQAAQAVADLNAARNAQTELQDQIGSTQKTLRNVIIGASVLVIALVVALVL